MADLHTNETNTALLSPIIHLKLPYNGENEALQSNNNLMHHHYQDHSNDFPSSTIRNNKIDEEREAKLFPIKLHNMLENVEQYGIESIVSWQPHGRCFVVHKQQEFINIMSKYFRQTKFPSFQRQLNIYGFSRITRGLDKGGYYHELFLRGRSFLCRGMQRMKIKGTRVRMATNPETEPNFYSMPPVFRRSCLIMDDNCLINESAPLPPPPPPSRYSVENDNQTEIIIANNDNMMTTECTALPPPPPPLIRRISSEEEQINTFTETKNHNYDNNFETSMLSSYSTKNEENKREEDEWDIDNSSLLKIADDEKKIFNSTTTMRRNSPDNHCHNHQTRKTNNNNGKNALMSMGLISASDDFSKKKTEKKPHDHQVFIMKNENVLKGKSNFIDGNSCIGTKESVWTSSSPSTNMVFDIDDVFSEFDEAIPLPGNASDFDELNDDLFFSSCC